MDEKHLTPRAEDYNQWYLDVIAAADMAQHSPVKGCMVIKPYGYAIWERIQAILDARFKETGVENAYFPLFIPQSLLTREADHVEGFAPEVAVVTHAGGEKLEEPLVIRPTSETIMYETFKDWIHSYRDLPLLINQWANVVRWEKRTRLFLRTTEFLWQEGHTVHATHEQADERARMMLEVYRDFAENVMAIPVIPGQKSESEKFAGAHRTYCLEAMMQDGRALQFATSHDLGQNFAKAFDVKFTDEQNVEQFAWQTSWGLSTRTIGGLIMAHSDDKGLIVPPRLAPIQVVVVPLWFKDEQRAEVLSQAEKIAALLKTVGVRVKIDQKEGRPGEKFYEWEKKGVPLRLELGPKDLLNEKVVVARRDSGEKEDVSFSNLAIEIPKRLEEIQGALFARAKAYRDQRSVRVDTWDAFKMAIENGKFVLAHWCGEAEVEAKIKEETNATIRCLPFEAPEEKGVCVLSGKPSQRRVVFARAY
ncbi:MAG TPA: proline--tRNA ligase [Patescibacteria group bacterium]|nr:proline--tRNA ligase [Patescibacteria group bacterium]